MAAIIKNQKLILLGGILSILALLLIVSCQKDELLDDPEDEIYQPTPYNLQVPLFFSHPFKHS